MISEEEQEFKQIHDSEIEDFDEETGYIKREIEIRVPMGKRLERIDIFLTRQIADLTRSMTQELISSGNISVNGKKVKASYKIKPQDHIQLEVLSRPPLDLEPQDIPLDIVYEDDWLILVNKPPGMVVHPAHGNKDGTLVNALLWHYGTLAPRDEPDRPGIVHRLDKDTSGLLVVCRKEPALSRMAKYFRDRTIKREYQAICWWNTPKRKDVIDGPIARDPRDRTKMTVRLDGKPARTHYFELERFDFLSLFSFKLETGRTHQIRVHTMKAGHPVFGDADYGGRNRQIGRLSSAQRSEVAEYLQQIDRQMLHAHTLGFIHPITREELMFEVPPPRDFQWLLSKLRARKKAMVLAGGR